MTTLLIASLAFTLALQPGVGSKDAEKTFSKTGPVRVSGTLNYRNACLSEGAQPVAPINRNPLNTGPYLYLSDSVGDRVSSIETTMYNGAFAFTDDIAPGQYQLHLAMGDLDQFSNGVEPLETIPVQIPAGGATVALGRICMNNERPRLVSVMASLGGDAVTTAAHGVIKLPDYDGPVFLKAETVSEDHHKVHIAWTATGGEIGGDQDAPVLDWIPGSEVFLHIVLTDDFGGTSSATMPIRLAGKKPLLFSSAQ